MVLGPAGEDKPPTDLLHCSEVDAYPIEGEY